MIWRTIAQVMTCYGAHHHVLQAIKKVNPDAVVISYLNSVVQYPWYGAARALPPTRAGGSATPRAL